MAKRNSTVTTAGRDPTISFTPMELDALADDFREVSEKFGELAALFDVIRRGISERDDLHKVARLGYGIGKRHEIMAYASQEWIEKLEKRGVVS